MLHIWRHQQRAAAQNEKTKRTRCFRSRRIHVALSRDEAERRRLMTRIVDTHPAATVPAGPSVHADDAESLSRLLVQGDIAEAFDEIARRRFGQMISAAALKPAKRRSAHQRART